MPFDNVPPTDAEKLGQLLRCDALRPRQQLHRMQMSERAAAGGGAKREKSKEDHPQGSEDGESSWRTSTAAPYFNQLGYIDRVIAVLDTLQYQYALRQTKDGVDNDGNSKRGRGTSEVAPAGSSTATAPGDGGGKKAAAQAPVERPQPFPSLFLQTPHEFVKESWAVVGKGPAERRADAEGLSASPPVAPPAALLSNTAPLPHSSCRRNDVKEESIPVSMYTLDLAKDRQAAQRVVTVLQSELGLAISTDYTGHSARKGGPDCRDPSSDKSDGNNKRDVFLLSPDATSCVLVACRVSLHPRWQVRAQALLSSTDAAPHGQDGRNGDHAEAKVGWAAFLSLALSTHTAAMAHLDQAKGLAAALHALVWEGSVPAWLHAVGHHFCATQLQGLVDSGTAANDSERNPLPHPYHGSHQNGERDGHKCGGESAEAAVRELQQLLLDGSREPIDAPLLEVEWYLVGGLQDKEHTAPVLTALFEQCFPYTGGSPCAESDEAAREQGGGRKTEETGDGLLATEAPLSSLLTDPKGQASASPGWGGSDELAVEVQTAETAAAVVIRIGHRLREDGICLWTFNTAFRTWRMDKNPKNRYAFPLCYGLLLNVSSGAAWPCQLQPGTRCYALATLRPLFATAYHATFPLEHEHRGLMAEAEGGRPKGSSEEVLWVYKQSLAFGEAVSGFWAKGTAAKVQAGEERTTPRLQPLTLALFVAECLHVLQLQQQQQQLHEDDRIKERKDEVARGSEPRGQSMLSFPFLLRTRLPDLWTRFHRDPSAISFEELPLQFFLQCSTTPHCEPPDFCALVKTQCICKSIVGPEDVYRTFANLGDADDGDGSGRKTAVGEGGEGKGKKPSSTFPADGILFVGSLS